MSITLTYLDYKSTQVTSVWSNPKYAVKQTVHTYYPFLYQLTDGNTTFYFYGLGFVSRNRTNGKLSFAFTIGHSTSQGHVGSYLPVIGDMVPNTKITETTNNGPKYEADFRRLTTLHFDKMNRDFVDFVQYDKILPTIVEYWFSIRNEPVYTEATKINYTDGTYEVIDGILTEQEAKDHAYKNLLETYGTFYKANETDISGYYNPNRGVNE